MRTDIDDHFTKKSAAGKLVVAYVDGVQPEARR